VIVDTAPVLFCIHADPAASCGHTSPTEAPARNDLGSLAAVVAEYRRDNERAVAGTSDARSNESADEVRGGYGGVDPGVQ
jgi:hypothetical protein